MLNKRLIYVIFLNVAMYIVAQMNISLSLHS